MKLSVLDQSPANENETGSVALKNTIHLAQMVEKWGYHRFWVAEHHGSNRVMSSSPEVLISHLLAKTATIKIGSGGVMLQHYSPYKVAENFNVLATLAPGRVDLGVGGGPGGLPKSTSALQQESSTSQSSLTQKVVQLGQFLQDNLSPDSDLYGLQASPLPPIPPNIFMLGTTVNSAGVAAELSLPYVFALFLNNDEKVMSESVGKYRSMFKSLPDHPAQVMLALPVVVADTEKEAALLASDIKVVRIELKDGRTFTVRSEEAAHEFGRQVNEEYSVSVQPPAVLHGSKQTIEQKLNDVSHHYDVDEFIIVTAIGDFNKRLRSYRLLAEVFN
ncbi:MAG: MsnO8 family LLM class oxidoreductase [Chloroflexota bacterium]|nr:MsnO8 family LLM class oxidoreductase [Chloroflexota bacterium]